MAESAEEKRKRIEAAKTAAQKEVDAKRKLKSFFGAFKRRVGKVNKRKFGENPKG